MNRKFSNVAEAMLFYLIMFAAAEVVLTLIGVFVSPLFTHEHQSALTVFLGNLPGGFIGFVLGVLVSMKIDNLRNRRRSR